MTEFTIEDMTCNHCVGVVTKTIKTLDPQAQVDVDLPSHKVKIESRVADGELAQALTDAGYEPTA